MNGAHASDPSGVDKEKAALHSLHTFSHQSCKALAHLPAPLILDVSSSGADKEAAAAAAATPLVPGPLHFTGSQPKLFNEFLQPKWLNEFT